MNAEGSELRSNDPSPMSNAGDGGVRTPTIDFDDWAVDPFSLSKEIDVFSSFAGVEEDAPNADSNRASFPPSSGAVVGKNSTLTGTEDKKTLVANQKSRKRNHAQQSQGKQATTVSSKNASSAKKRSDCIPISRRKKKPKGMPKRPLSAYNLYFQAERTNIIASQQAENGPRIGFEGLGKIVGKKWRDLSSADKKEYEKLAEKDSERYRREMDAYQKKKAKRFEEEAASRTPVVSSIPSSTTSAQAAPFDLRFPKRQGSIQIVTIGGEGVGNSVAFAHPPESMVSSVSSLPPGTTTIPYRPAHSAHVEQPQSRHALQQNSILEALNIASAVGGAVTRVSPPNYYPHQTVPDNGDLPPYTVPHRNDNYPMQPGMEVVLADRNGIDRKYRVQYTCYSMTRQNANKYIESLTRSSNSSSTTPAPPPPPPVATTMGANTEYGVWGV